MAQFVREVMTPAATTVRPDASLVEAAQLMRAQDIGDVLVAKEGRLVGVLTDRDIALRAVADGVDPLSVSCRSVCTPDPVTVDPDTEVGAAVHLMREHAVRRLPVLDHGKLTGVVSIGDLAKENDPHSALAQISRAAPDSWRQEGAAGWM
ncbi:MULTISPECIES: CBS domain-containing protein [unclassified Streptomyces]|uniref:CBS domain-containing protein n=1 Tax=unclassified Streptomyces TaxID=2593676 RepID=UPI002DD7E3CC|nr:MULTISPECIES: CBS domain-containing protein [unclassified Streptomyces]WSA91477.1 CBS domain-containing protein [Streptomyces sp. NBC_01795]WSB75849.1 CBS domain-containing protein [Streptomyces sp. NBC_01775]WSS15876.1 CBS domain-containing protein [Streptomyces sp. NBC_01186]WSS44716.1 CBS domain-containing protein [Streptomyces sp. NBC_01187]